jgi:hypothetical protein
VRHDHVGVVDERKVVNVGGDGVNRKKGAGAGAVGGRYHDWFGTGNGCGTDWTLLPPLQLADD